jgi:hypothetical protein
MFGVAFVDEGDGGGEECRESEYKLQMMLSGLNGLEGVMG